jgi:LmbE family N-acetylglucosaminyl deacetylase
MLISILLILFFSIAGLWIFGFVYANDFSVRTKSLSGISTKYKNILIIFPHADDEALSSGGVISQLSNSEANLHWLILTKGEKGNEAASIDEQLKEVRVEEARRAAHFYGINNLIQREYPDNGVDEFKDRLTTELEQTIDSVKPDLIITYDLAGLYGHPDHMVVSEVVTNLVKKNFPDTKLCYVSYPKKILGSISLPEHMAEDKFFKGERAYPNFKVWVGLRGVINKIEAVYTYKSQRQSFVSSFPVKFIPLWFYVSLTPYEYFYEAN